MLFTEKLTTKLCQLYKDQSNPFYALATKPHNERIRIQIEEWLLDIPETGRSKMLKKFRTDHQNTQSIVTELLAGSLLARKGFQLEYEPKFGSLTPDWLVRDSAGNSAIAEVLNLKMPEDMKIEWDRVTNIQDKLQCLTHPVAFHVRTSKKDIEEKEMKLIDNWLETQPNEGDVFVLPGFEIEIARWNPKYTHSQPIGPSSAFWGRPNRLKIRIHEKAEYYKKITNEGVPLILIFKNDFLSAVDLDDVDTILMGADKKDQSEGLFYNEARNLGAFIWLDGDFTSIRSTFILNNRATPNVKLELPWKSSSGLY